MAHSKAPGLGITERASERPANARAKRAIDENLTAASPPSRKCPRRRGGPRHNVVRPELDEVIRMGRKAASRAASSRCELTTHEKLPSSRLRGKKKSTLATSERNEDQPSSHGGLAEENTPRVDAAVVGARQLRLPRRRPRRTDAAPAGAGREERTGQTAGASGVCLPRRGRLRSAHYNGVQRPTRPVPGALAKKTHAARGRSTSRQQISNMKHSKFGSS
ncbi:hypothetical protein THAOC_15934 [Thalassiosira oceanica]|uniref:Uncharacterized protein n=1 Tax=Thalassiosira oceanica TaxID=159749 RepID=K0SYT8_THAOC|nr:hypothetical protein THAOC_15934 [Thalassiosira oceanica]|eukprot:EJK63407.1 hypothetical protein THAOC_15934 [Thalassiosira oceanica]